MSKTISRLLVFFIGIPVVLALVWMPWGNHLALHVLLVAVSAVSALELHGMLSHSMSMQNKALVAVLSAFIPLVALVSAVFPAAVPPRLSGGTDVLTAALVASLVVSLAAEVFTARDFAQSNGHLAGSFFIILYAGYLITFLSRLTTATVGGADASVPLIASFLLMVFLCDSLAWLFGVLLGKGNRGVVKASPNKSIAGFAGGFAGAIAAGIASRYIWPQVFGTNLLPCVVTAVFTAFAAIVGDLAESVCKRSAGMKDSGSIIPGRGGLLDSIDSILLAAPLYYLLAGMFFGPFGA